MNKWINWELEKNFKCECKVIVIIFMYKICRDFGVEVWVWFEGIGE